MSEEVVLRESDVVRLARGVRVHHDKVRERSVLLAPERTLALDPIALAIVGKLDGEASIGEVADGLASQYGAPRDQVFKDCVAFLQELANRRLLEISR